MIYLGEEETLDVNFFLESNFSNYYSLEAIKQEILINFILSITSNLSQIEKSL